MRIKDLLLASLICLAFASNCEAEVYDSQEYTGLIKTGVQVNGGALYLSNQNEAENIINSSFKNNQANGSLFSLGGAIFSSAKDVSIINSSFVGNFAGGADDRNLGGAIFADGSGMKDGSLTISDSSFINNYVKDNNLMGTSNKVYAGGGAITLQYYKDINISNTVFQGNYAEGSTNILLGGAIAPSAFLSPIGPNYGTTQTLNITGSTFKENYLSNTVSNYGGAIGSLSTLELNIKDSLFEGNAIISGTSNRGGAIYTQLSKLNIENTNFVGNTITSGSASYGGAIFGIGSEMTIKNSSFINNSTTGAGGGAIFFQGNGAATPGVLNIIADGKNVEFTGNRAGSIADAIYASSNTRINLNAAGGNKITFNDRIYLSSTNGILAINNPDVYSDKVSNGEIILNGNMNYVYGQTTIYGGTVRVGENGTFFNNTAMLTLKDGVNIDLQNGKIDGSIVKNLVIDGTTDVKIDADLANSRIDSFEVASTSGSGNFNITSIDVLSDTDQNSISKDFITGAGASSVNTTLDSSLNTVFTSEKRYDITLNDNKLTFDKSAYTDGLAGAIAYNGDCQYQMNSDEVVFGWSSGPDVQGGVTVVKANENSIIGNGIEGLKLSTGQELSLNNVGKLDSNGNIQGSLNGFNSEKGGAVYNDNGTVNVIDSVISNNTANEKGGAIYNDGGIVNIVANASDVVFDGNKAGDDSNAIHTVGGTLNFNSSSDSSIVFNDKITSQDNSSIININSENALKNAPSSGVVVLNNDMSGYTGDVNLHHGTIKVGANGTFFNPNNFNISGCTLDFANSVVQQYSLGNLNITGDLDMKVDADLLHNSMDTIKADSINSGGVINISNINLLTDSVTNNKTLSFADDNLKGSVVYTGSDDIFSKIYRYNVMYDRDNGTFNFAKAGGGGGYRDYNPGLFAGPVAAQLGGYLSQLNSYDQAFLNIDMKMLMPGYMREAIKYRNKYAALNTPMVYSPLFSQEQKAGAWFRPYSSFENVPLKGGPKVSNVMYGTFMGVDSDFKELGHGFDGQFSVYAGYNGSHQAFDGVSMYQNGGNLGFTGAVYKGNFFSALTANAGAASVDASNLFGSESFPMLMAGVASKTGYNIELLQGKFIIQPSYMMSYTFVNAFNYNNAAGLRMNSDPLNAIQIQPGIKFIGNLKNGWQPYLGVNMVWNIMDKAKFSAADVSLPELSVKPFVEYGVGVQKLWGDRFTGFFQTMLRSGGRNGIALSLGFRWSFGKAPVKSQIAPPKEISNKTDINLSCNRK